MKTTIEDHNLYLTCDVLLLENIFEKFRKKYLQNYGLCPSHYLRVSALSWDTFLSQARSYFGC